MINKIKQFFNSSLEKRLEQTDNMVLNLEKLGFEIHMMSNGKIHKYNNHVVFKNPHLKTYVAYDKVKNCYYPVYMKKKL